MEIFQRKRRRAERKENIDGRLHEEEERGKKQYEKVCGGGLDVRVKRRATALRGTDMEKHDDQKNFAFAERVKKKFPVKVPVKSERQRCCSCFSRGCFITHVCQRHRGLP